MFLKIGGYREYFKYSQDIDLWLRFSQKTNIVFVKEYLVISKRNKNQISIINRKEQSIYGFIAKLDYLIFKKNKNQKIILDQNLFKWVDDQLNNIGVYKFEKLKNDIRVDLEKFNLNIFKYLSLKTLNLIFLKCLQNKIFLQ